MGYELPKNITYEVYPNHATFYRQNSFGEWNMIGYLQIPYQIQSLEYWKKRLDEVLKK